MARTDLVVNEVGILGVDESVLLTAANVDGHAIPNGGDVWVVIENTDVALKTITFQTPRVIDGLAVAEHVVTVAQNERKVFAGFSKDTFNQKISPDAGKMLVDFSAITGLVIAAFRRSG